MSSTAIRNQEVHTNGPVLDDQILLDPEVNLHNQICFWLKVDVIMASEPSVALLCLDAISFPLLLA